MARHVALKSGMKETTSALNINRLCGSGFQSCVNVAQEIKLGEAAIGVAAGAESMSQAPMSVYGHEVRWGTKLGSPTEMKDTLWAGLTDSHAGIPMGVTAENLAADYSITRGESDAYALESQARWAKAKAAGKFDDEIAPIELKSRKGPITFDTDEHPKPTTTPAQMAKLPTTFKKDGVVTPASASGICDGAGALILASEAAVKQHGLEPLCELVGWASVGVDPTRMGIGPVPAIRAALDRAGMSMVDIDRVEINEAFAPQIMACAKELGLDMAKTNINGGAIALGHPLGASGSRITMHLAHAIKRGEVKAAIGSACIGGGQGIALVLKEAEM
jgi:acetyl-CoA acyltransferase 2